MAAAPRIATRWDAEWQPEFIGTLMFIVRGDEVLLIHKKTGHGAGVINGPGGKLQPGESLLECAVRETGEEVGLRPVDPYCGMELRFVERNGPQWLGFAFLSTAFEGRLRETSEARPFWCPIRALPYPRMWPDDAVWLPRLLAGDGRRQPLVANFLFDDGRLLEHEFVVAPSIWQTLALPGD